jgi:arylsulfatase A-like enzyme
LPDILCAGFVTLCYNKWHKKFVGLKTSTRRKQHNEAYFYSESGGRQRQAFEAYPRHPQTLCGTRL